MATGIGNTKIGSVAEKVIDDRFQVIIVKTRPLIRCRVMIVYKQCPDSVSKQTVLQGGFWSASANSLPIATRYYYHLSNRNYAYGFRGAS